MSNQRVHHTNTKLTIPLQSFHSSNDQSPAVVQLWYECGASTRIRASIEVILVFYRVAIVRSNSSRTVDLLADASRFAGRWKHRSQED
jgi:hypothetical protein